MGFLLSLSFFVFYGVYKTFNLQQIKKNEFNLIESIQLLFGLISSICFFILFLKLNSKFYCKKNILFNKINKQLKIRTNSFFLI